MAREGLRSTYTRAWFAAVAITAVVTSTGLGSAPAQVHEKAAPPSDSPNFVVVMTDDQSMHSFIPSAMPKTFKFFEDGGTEFTNGLAAPPLCCPDRAGFLTAQYPHNHGVEDNHPGYRELIDPDNTLPVWLDNAGYRTGFVGKYMNGTSKVLGAQPAPGWDYWYALNERPRYFGATVSNQGESKTLSSDEYLTTALNRQASRFIKRTSSQEPFFLWLGQYAPHARRNGDGYCSGSVPEPLPRDLSRFRNASLEKRPSFNERDVSDKPEFIRSLDRLERPQKRQLERNYRCTLAAMREVDRGFGELTEQLRESGELEDTIVVFTSDNGMLFGEHRVMKGKTVAYEEALRVPLMMRAGSSALGGIATEEVNEPVAQLDLAPTFLELADAQPCPESGECRRMDGRSLADLVLRGDTAWPSDRGVLAEAREMAEAPSAGPLRRGSLGGPCGFAAIRTRADVLSIRGEETQGTCANGPEEYYDLQADPFQLENGADDPAFAPTVNELRIRLENLRRCSGISGRDAPLVDRTFCE